MRLLYSKGTGKKQKMKTQTQRVHIAKWKANALGFEKKCQVINNEKGVYNRSKNFSVVFQLQ